MMRNLARSSSAKSLAERSSATARSPAAGREYKSDHRDRDEVEEEPHVGA